MGREDTHMCQRTCRDRLRSVTFRTYGTSPPERRGGFLDSDQLHWIARSQRVGLTRAPLRPPWFWRSKTAAGDGFTVDPFPAPQVRNGGVERPCVAVRRPRPSFRIRECPPQRPPDVRQSAPADW